MTTEKKIKRFKNTKIGKKASFYHKSLYRYQKATINNNFIYSNIVTDKGVKLETKYGIVALKVFKNINKITIRKSFSAIFQVKVYKVNTLNRVNYKNNEKLAYIFVDKKDLVDIRQNIQKQYNDFIEAIKLNCQLSQAEATSVENNKKQEVK